VSSGAKVVLALFGGTLAVALIAVAAFLLTDQPNLECVEGELQDNQVDANGNFIPRVESFDTRQEAEAFICHEVPYPRDTAGMTLSNVVVTRNSNLGKLIEGTGFATVSLDYAFDDGPARLTLDATIPIGALPPAEDGEPITVQGEKATLTEAPDDEVYVTWDKGSFHFVAHGRLGDDLQLEDLLRILESVR
jgi:hypothetical protein